MFLVKDKSEEREERILEFLDNEYPIAVLLAVIHFEWTIRRAIISLSNKPNKIIREDLGRISGIDKYKEYWNKNISQCNGFQTLPELIPDWSLVIEATKLRNRLVHGVSSCPKKTAVLSVEAIIKASGVIRDFCIKNNIDLEKRLKIKRKVKI